MKYTYEENTDMYGNTTILRYVDGELNAIIPSDPANSDYQRYLNPEAEQSTLGLVNSDNPAEPVV
jgi:hypothetical protein